MSRLCVVGQNNITLLNCSLQGKWRQLVRPGTLKLFDIKSNWNRVMHSTNGNIDREDNFIASIKTNFYQSEKFFKKSDQIKTQRSNLNKLKNKSLFAKGQELRTIQNKINRKNQANVGGKGEEETFLEYEYKHGDQKKVLTNMEKEYILRGGNHQNFVNSILLWIAEDNQYSSIKNLVNSSLEIEQDKGLVLYYCLEFVVQNKAFVKLTLQNLVEDFIIFRRDLIGGTVVGGLDITHVSLGKTFWKGKHCTLDTIGKKCKCKF